MFSASRKKTSWTLDVQKPLSSWNNLWDSKVGAFTSSQTGIFWKKIPCANSFKTFQPIFLGGGDSQGSNCPNATDFFLEFPMLNLLIGWWCKPDRSALSPAESPQSWHLEFSSLGTWFLWRGVMEARLKLHPMTCIFRDTESLWFLKDYRFYIDYYFQSSPTHCGFTVCIFLDLKSWKWWKHFRIPGLQLFQFLNAAWQLTLNATNVEGRNHMYIAIRPSNWGFPKMVGSPNNYWFSY